MRVPNQTVVVCWGQSWGDGVPDRWGQPCHAWQNR